VPRTLGSTVESRTCQAHRWPGSNSLTKLACRNRFRLEIWKRLVAHHQPERAKAAWRILTTNKHSKTARLQNYANSNVQTICITGKIWARFAWQWYVFRQAPGLEWYLEHSTRWLSMQSISAGWLIFVNLGKNQVEKHKIIRYNYIIRIFTQGACKRSCQVEKSLGLPGKIK